MNSSTLDKSVVQFCLYAMAVALEVFSGVRLVLINIC